MHTPPALPDPATRTEQALVELNARIARLGPALGIPLDEETNIQAVLHKQHGQLAAYFPEGLHAQDNANSHHRAHALEELRGLLVLRYTLVEHTIEDEGLSVARHIALEAEIDTERKGFKPGMDGFDLLPSLEAATQAPLPAPPDPSAVATPPATGR